MEYDYKKIEYKFYYLKNILNDKFMPKEEVNGFYFPILAIKLIKNSNLNYFMNPYFNLSIDDVLNMTEQANSLIDVKKELFNSYKSEYAEAWYKNYLQVINSLKEEKIW